MAWDLGESLVVSLVFYGGVRLLTSPVMQEFYVRHSMKTPLMELPEVNIEQRVLVGKGYALGAAGWVFTVLYTNETNPLIGFALCGIGVGIVLAWDKRVKNNAGEPAPSQTEESPPPVDSPE